MRPYNLIEISRHHTSQDAIALATVWTRIRLLALGRSVPLPRLLGLWKLGLCFCFLFGEPLLAFTLRQGPPNGP